MKRLTVFLLTLVMTIVLFTAAVSAEESSSPDAESLQAQYTLEQVVILSSVVSYPESAAPFHQRAAESRKMADIIVRKKIIGREIRLKMNEYNVLWVWPFKGRFVGINEIGIFFTNRLYHVIKRGGMEQIVMIEQSKIITLRH